MTDAVPVVFAVFGVLVVGSIVALVVVACGTGIALMLRYLRETKR